MDKYIVGILDFAKEIAKENRNGEPSNIRKYQIHCNKESRK